MGAAATRSMNSCPQLPSPTAAHPPARGKGWREGGSAVPSTRGSGSSRHGGAGNGAGAGWGWQGNAMETRRRDAEPRASSRAGARRRKGDNGAGQAELPPQAVLLCCSAPSVSCQAPAPLLSPAGDPPRRQRVPSRRRGLRRQKSPGLGGCWGKASVISVDGLLSVTRVCKQQPRALASSWG